jgi:DNA-binding response OmpR family regulator
MPTLLVVDDERNVLYALEKGLRADGLRIVTAQTGKAGINLVQCEKPDAVLLDVRLPDLSGLDVLKELRQIDPKASGDRHDDARDCRDGNRGNAARGL